MNLHIISTPSTQSAFSLFLVFVRCMGLDKCVMICMQPYGTIQDIFTALKILCASLNNLSCPLQSLNDLSFHCLHSFTFFKMSHGWNQYTVFLDWRLSLSTLNLMLFHAFSWHELFKLISFPFFLFFFFNSKALFKKYKKNWIKGHGMSFSSSFLFISFFGSFFFFFF